MITGTVGQILVNECGELKWRDPTPEDERDIERDTYNRIGDKSMCMSGD